MQRTSRKRGLFAWSAVIAAAFGLASAPYSLAQVTSGTWTALAHQPSFYPDTMLLLTDGTVLVNEDLVNGNGANWWKLTPDSTGSYINGTWKQVASAHNDRLFFASAVLADGRMFVSGGEYSNSGGSETNKTEIYDPVANTWTNLSAPGGWSNVGDAPCTVRPDGKLLLGSIFDNKTAIFDPTTNAFTAGPNKSDATSTEEAWELQPNNNIIVVECLNHPASEQYVNSSNTFVNVGNIPHDLVDPSSFECGAAILCPNGITFAIGATVATDLYNYTTNSWTAGPNPPSGLGAEDAPAALMPNGHVLFSLGPTGTFNGPSTFFEYDPVANTITQVNAPPTANQPPFVGRMLLTPNGQVLYSVGEAGDKRVYVYTPVGSPQSSWAPTITTYTSTLLAGNTYSISGTQFNGLSQDCGYGDDASMATNYPLVQLTNTSSGAVTYCRTHGHSTMGVATGSATVSTNFDVPASQPTGTYALTVIANGIPSTAVTVTVGPVATATLSSVSLNPTTVIGGTSSAGTVTLASAQSSDIVVTLSSSNTAVAQVPGNVLIPHGSTSANFTVTTSGVNSNTSVTISATSANTVTAILVVQPLVSGVSLNPTTVNGGSSSTGTVTLSEAQSSNTVITLSSSNTAAAQVPANVTVPAGQTSANFTVTTSTVNNDTNVTISASNGNTVTAILTVKGILLTNLTLDQSSVAGGAQDVGHVFLGSNATGSGAIVSLSSSNTSVATVPASVTVGGGHDTAPFFITTFSVNSDTQVTISATLNGVTKTAVLTVTAPHLVSFTLNLSKVKGGKKGKVTGTVTLDTDVTQDTSVAISSSDPVNCIVPATVTIKSGSNTAKVKIKTKKVTSQETVTISATFNGTTLTQNLTITP